MTSLNILVLGAAYGLLPAVRICLAGHRVTLVCRDQEQAQISDHGASVTLLRRGGQVDKRLHVPARRGLAAEGVLGLTGTEVSPEGFDLVLLAMGEPQYAAPEVTALVQRIGEAGLPVISLMNAPPPPFLRRLSTFDVAELEPAYRSWAAWQAIDPERITAASPDAQAVRLDPERPNDLTVTLTSNFKVAPFARPAHQEMLETLARDVSAYRVEGAPLPVRILSHRAVHVPLAKWPMLIAGNCRCLRPDGSIVTIREAVHTDLEESRALYDWTLDVVLGAGAERDDLVPFEPYAKAALALTRPSSFAKAIGAGAPAVERVDKMVQRTAQALGLGATPGLDALVEQVDAVLATRNG